MGILKKIDTVVTVIGIASSAYGIMMKAFNWYEKKHNSEKKKEISRPVIKGI